MSDPSASTSARPNIVNAGASSSRDGTARAKVQQLKPTNKATTPDSAPAAGQANGAQGTTTAAAAPELRRTVPRIITGHNAGTTILVNSRQVRVCVRKSSSDSRSPPFAHPQKGNPLLQHIRNVGWEYGDIVPDYQVGVASCVLFLS